MRTRPVRPLPSGNRFGRCRRVAVGKRVNGLKVGMGDCDVGQGAKVGSVGEGDEVGHCRGHTFVVGRNVHGAVG
jgi:hypothetical protein